MQPADPSWGSAYPTIVHAVWMQTGRNDIITRHLDSVVRYMHTLEAAVSGSGLSHMFAKYADWFPPAGAASASKSLVSAATFIHDSRLVAAMAEAVGNSSVHHHFAQLSADLATQFNAAWLHNGSYASGLQTELALPLFLDIVPQAQQQAVVEALVRQIEHHDKHVTSGIIGTRAIYEALAKNGRMDVALAMLAKTDFPSYGYMVQGNVYEPSTTVTYMLALASIIRRLTHYRSNDIVYVHAVVGKVGRLRLGQRPSGRLSQPHHVRNDLSLLSQIRGGRDPDREWLATCFHRAVLR